MKLSEYDRANFAHRLFIELVVEAMRAPAGSGHELADLSYQDIADVAFDAVDGFVDSAAKRGAAGKAAVKAAVSDK